MKKNPRKYDVTRAFDPPSNPLTSHVPIVKEKIYVTGIDTSSAFDIIKREILIEILDDDELEWSDFFLQALTSKLK